MCILKLHVFLDMVLLALTVPDPLLMEKNEGWLVSRHGGLSDVIMTGCSKY